MQYSLYLIKCKDTHPTKPNMNIILVSICYVVFILSSVTMLLLFIPKQVMHASFFVLPVLNIGVAAYFRDTTMIILSVIFGAISLLLYFFYFRKNIKYSAEVVKSSTSLLLRNAIVFFYTHDNTLYFINAWTGICCMQIH